uniref:Uncharacterized protein n=1 Tax=Anguilla anguilla TaxID=7936 RepID=A0A0E9PTV2_ANGAN
MLTVTFRVTQPLSD